MRVRATYEELGKPRAGENPSYKGERVLWDDDFYREWSALGFRGFVSLQRVQTPGQVDHWLAVSYNTGDTDAMR